MEEIPLSSQSGILFLSKIYNVFEFTPDICVDNYTNFLRLHRQPGDTIVLYMVDHIHPEHRQPQTPTHLDLLREKRDDLLLEQYRSTDSAESHALRDQLFEQTLRDTYQDKSVIISGLIIGEKRDQGMQPTTQILRDFHGRIDAVFYSSTDELYPHKPIAYISPSNPDGSLQAILVDLMKLRDIQFAA